MILTGKTVLARAILRGVSSPSNQVQPCGIDLSLRRVFQWTSHGVIDFDNTFRKTASTVEIPFETSSKNVHLKQGAYLVEFNETIDTPLDVMGQLFVRSSLFRSGAVVSAGAMDAGYQGAIGMRATIRGLVLICGCFRGAMLQVFNPHGLILYRDAKLAQFIFHEMNEKVRHPFAHTPYRIDHS
jgi:dUTP pyrophosphatase